MSTSDPSTLSVPVDAVSTKTPAGSPAAVDSFPDVAVIARLANEFFSALPSQATPLDNVGAGVSARATASPATVPNATTVTPDVLNVPSGSPSYLPSPEKLSPFSIAPSFPTGGDVFSFPAVPGAHSAPGALPQSPVQAAAPLTDAELAAIPVSLADVPSPARVPSTGSLPAIPGSSAYFLDGLTRGPSDPLSAAPSFPPDSEMFSFPGVPGAQSLPGIPAFPSSLPTAPGEPAATPAGPGSPTPATDGAKTTAPAATDPVQFHSFEFRPELVPEIGLAKRQFDPHIIKRDFPILQEQVNGRPLVWLDNAATTQKPNTVIERLSYFYRHENSNIHRAAHTLAARSTDAYEGAREKVRRFLNASSTREIVFVRGATEAINLVAKSWGHRNVQKDDEIVITWLEHHANIVPWQQLAAEKGARLRVAPVDDSGQVILEEYEKSLGPRTRIVSFSHVSNALGTITPAREMIEMAHRHGARVLVDGAQSVAHLGADVQSLDCDFFVFSGHKIFGPTGIGVVFGKADLLDNSPPWQGGGNMIADVTFEKTIYQAAPARFEAGTGNIADAVGLGAALDYLDEIGLENIARYEHELLEYATVGLLSVPGLRLIGTAKEKAGVISFVLDTIPPEEVGKALDQEGIAVRAGHHCAQPILRRFGVEKTVRPSLALYNTREDVDALVAAVLRLQTGRGHRGL